MGVNALQEFRGKGVAAAPIFGFHAATDQQMRSMGQEISGLSARREQWGAILGTGNEGASTLPL